MAPTAAGRRSAIVAALGFCVAAAAGSVPGQRLDLEPGLAVIETRDRGQLRLRLDRDATVYPAQLQGQSLIIRHLVKKVYVPQSWQPFAEEWREVGGAVVLPIHRTGGDFMARLVWEDPKQPARVGDRVELTRVPEAASRPLIASLRCLGRAGEKPVAAPGETVWLRAEVASLRDVPAECEWSCSAGEFVYAGGLAAGPKVSGPPLVHWRAPAPAPDSGKASIQLKVTAGPLSQPSEGTLELAIARAAGPYVRVGWTRSRVPGLRDALGPLFEQATAVAAGPPGSFFLVDGPNERLLHWRGGAARYVPLGGSGIDGLAGSGGGACVARDGALFRLGPDAAKLARLGPLPEVKRPVGLATNAAGDLYLLDSGAPPALHVRPAEGSWQTAPLEPRVDSPSLRAFGVDPRSNDVYILDTRDRMVRQWRALQGVAYGSVDVPIAVGRVIDKLGEPVALLVRPDRDPVRDLPVQLVFKSGVLTDKWTPQGEPPRWEPTTTSQPRQLVQLRFAATGATVLPNGDVLLAGKTAASGAEGPAVVQLSPRGDFRRMLPLPETAPTLVAVAPDGRRYVVLDSRPGRRGGERLVVVDPEGWMLQDFGPLDGYREVTGLRPDRRSPGHVLLIADRQRRESVFRIDAADPTRTLELSSAGLPGGRIPEHEAIDAASSADRIVVLDGEGKVLVFANRKPIAYLTAFETELRRPQAIALTSHVTADGSRHGCICVLASDGGPSIHVWAIRTADAGKQVVERLGRFPDPERAPAAARLSEPVAIDSAFPDQPGLLYVLNREGKELRVFDVPAIAAKVRHSLPPDLPTAPVIATVPVQGDALDLSVGPGQVVHIADPEGEGIQTYARRP